MKGQGPIYKLQICPMYKYTQPLFSANAITLSCGLNWISPSLFGQSSKLGSKETNISKADYTV